MTTVKLERTLDQSAASSVQNRSEKVAGAQGDTGYNLQSTQALLSILTSRQGQVTESLNHTLSNLNRNLSTLVKGQSAAADDSQYAQTQTYLKLTQSLGKSDPKVEENLAQGLSSSTRYVRARDAYQNYKDNFDKLPAALKQSETGTYLSKTVLQSLADLSSENKIGAGLKRDLNLHQISVSSATPGQKQAAARTLKAALSYIQSNQPEILQKEAQKRDRAAQAAKSSTAARTQSTQSSQTQAQSAAPSSANNDAGQTYLDIFKKNAKAQSASPEPVPEPQREKIRTLVQKAADIAKSGNLYPQTSSAQEKSSTAGTSQSSTPASAQTTPESSNAQTAQAAKSDEAAAPASKASLKEEAQNLSRQSDVPGSQLSLSELSARAAKLQMQFTRERQRLIREGKLPDPAKLPDYYEQELRQLEKEGPRHSQKDARPAEEIFTIPRRVYQSPLLQRSVQSLGTNLPAAADQASTTDPAAQQGQPVLPTQGAAGAEQAAQTPQVPQSAPAAPQANIEEFEQAKAQIAELKNELLQFQKEALAAAKEAVSVQLETQKQLQAQAKIWYQTLQDAGQIASNTLAELKEQNARAQALLQQGAELNAQGTPAQSQAAPTAGAGAAEEPQPQAPNQQAPQAPVQEEAPAARDPMSTAEDGFDKTIAALYSVTAQSEEAPAATAQDKNLEVSGFMGPGESSVNYAKQTVDAQGRTMAGFYQYVNIDNEAPAQTQDKASNSAVVSKEPPAQETAQAPQDKSAAAQSAPAAAQESAAPVPAEVPDEAAKSEAVPAQEEPEPVPQQAQVQPQEESVTQAAPATQAPAPAQTEQAVQQPQAQEGKADLSRLYQEQLLKEGQLQTGTLQGQGSEDLDLLQMPSILNPQGMAAATSAAAQAAQNLAAQSAAVNPSLASELDFTVQRPTQSNVLLDESFDENFNFSRLYQEAGTKAPAQQGAPVQPSPALDAQTIMQVRPSDELEDEDTLQGVKNLNLNPAEGEELSPVQAPAAAAVPGAVHPGQDVEEGETQPREASKDGLLRRLASFFH